MITDSSWDRLNIRLEGFLSPGLSLHLYFCLLSPFLSLASLCFSRLCMRFSHKGFMCVHVHTSSPFAFVEVSSWLPLCALHCLSQHPPPISWHPSSLPSCPLLSVTSPTISLAVSVVALLSWMCASVWLCHSFPKSLIIKSCQYIETTNLHRWPNKPSFSHPLDGYVGEPSGEQRLRGGRGKWTHPLWNCVTAQGTQNWLNV